jgi:hypothetical protein
MTRAMIGGIGSLLSVLSAITPADEPPVADVFFMDSSIHA